jgi:hypothetical protein
MTVLWCNPCHNILFVFQVFKHSQKAKIYFLAKYQSTWSLEFLNPDKWDVYVDAFQSKKTTENGVIFYSCFIKISSGPLTYFIQLSWTKLLMENFKSVFLVLNFFKNVFLFIIFFSLAYKEVCSFREKIISFNDLFIPRKTCEWLANSALPLKYKAIITAKNLTIQLAWPLKY